jgi:hypothetical protein
MIKGELMDKNLKEIVWRQFGASIDMLENAIKVCPEEVWRNAPGYHEFWYITYHTLFWLDFYLSESPDRFSPPPPYTLSEFDPEGKLPDRVYTKGELLNYLEHGRKKCRIRINNLTDEESHRHFVFGSIDLSIMELILYNMRHVQHHTAQLNLLLRQKIDSAPRWVKQTKSKLNSE